MQIHTQPILWTRLFTETNKFYCIHTNAALFTFQAQNINLFIIFCMNVCVFYVEKFYFHLLSKFNCFKEM